MRRSNIALGAGAICFAALTIATPAQASEDTKVEIIDPDHHLSNTENTARAIQVKEFPPGTRVGVLISDDSSLTKDEYDSKVKRYAMDHLPATLVNKGSNDLQPKALLIAISPGLHKMGVYGGKETGINSTWVSSALEAMKPYAQSESWDEMALAGAQSVSNSAMGGGDTPSTAAATESKGDEQESVFSSLMDSMKKWFIATIGTILAVTAAMWGGRYLLGRRQAAAERERTRLAQEKEKAAREEKLKAMDRWSGPSADLTDLCLVKWDEVEAQYRELNLSMPEEDAECQRALREHRDHGYELPMEKRRDTQVVNILNRATEGGDSCASKAVDRLEREKRELAFYRRELDGWESKWSECYDEITEHEFLSLSKSLSKAKDHLSKSDYTSLSDTYENSLAEARRINDDVLHHGADIRDSREDLESLNTRTKERVKVLTGRITPSGSPRGMRPRRSSSAGRSSSGNSYDLIPLLWASQAVSSSSSHGSSHSSSYSSSSFSGGYGGSSSSSSGGFDGGSGSW